VTPGSWDPPVLDDLARRSARGDHDALDVLLGYLRPGVLRQCSRILPNHADAEDACQEALLRISEGISTYSGRARITTWAYAVTANSVRDTYRRLRRLGETAPLHPVEVTDPRRTSVIAGTRVDVLEALEVMEASSPELVAPFVLRDLQGLPYDDIAAVLGRPLGTVKRQIHDARVWMRERL
jgi:RNA polymerase sigma-70 factor (ECF subfamily)